ncbi:hypothetical protein FOXYSP1_16739 [Fusarium oxysporum f. sp. phaseoli]
MSFMAANSAWLILHHPRVWHYWRWKLRGGFLTTPPTTT